ncbi:MAG TPA: YfhO family protein [Planctomycetaceae bacterium]|jgi:hypothetical protein|nr:YfhO family protein [Planctomycetaceae bacterium]
MTVRGLKVVLAAVGFTLLFWWPLARGGGLVGGDTYRYFLPQKVVYAELLRRHELPVWNSWVGFGYPILGESQTGVFYPPNVVLYSLLSVNSAYNANFLLHYVLAFVFAWMYARAIGLASWGGGLAALVYTFGWFPPRSGLEWAILTGAWFPAALWCCERFLQTRRAGFALALSSVLCLQLLAGHFNLAFLSVLTLAAYAPLRLFVANRDLSAESRSIAKSLCGFSLAAIAGAGLLGAVQIAPTWELMRLSQRVEQGPDHNLRSGAIPVWYLSQMVRPWYWYALGTDRQAALDAAQTDLGGRTNPVEAHLFVGLVPLVLALVWIVIAVRTRDRLSLVWAALGIAALVYTTGRLVPIGEHLPGFSFFSAPGRYGLITTLAVGLLAGKALDWLRSTNSLVLQVEVLLGFASAMYTGLMLTTEGQDLPQLNGTPDPFTLGGVAITDAMVSALLLAGVLAALVIWLGRFLARGSTQRLAVDCGRWVFTACAFTAPTLEFWLVSRIVTDSDLVDDPPIRHLEESPVRQILSRWNGGTARLFSPGANLPSVLGAAVTPPYLTFAPAAYFDPALKMPTHGPPADIDELGDATPTRKEIDWLRRAGVTHVLSFDPLDVSRWHVTDVWQGVDPLLNPALARFQKPLFLYELDSTRGRVAWASSSAGQQARITDYQPNRVAIEARSPVGGRLILTDLMYPDWTLTVDGSAAEPHLVEGQFRGVDLPAGTHTVVWSYKPRLVYWGMLVSAAAWISLAVAAVIFWLRSRAAHSLNRADAQ